VGRDFGRRGLALCALSRMIAPVLEPLMLCGKETIRLRPESARSRTSDAPIGQLASRLRPDGITYEVRRLTDSQSAADWAKVGPTNPEAEPFSADFAYS
jgi:hypothetical protein